MKLDDFVICVTFSPLGSKSWSTVVKYLLKTKQILIVGIETWAFDTLFILLLNNKKVQKEKIM